MIAPVIHDSVLLLVNRERSPVLCGAPAALFLQDYTPAFRQVKRFLQAVHLAVRLRCAYNEGGSVRPTSVVFHADAILFKHRPGAADFGQDVLDLGRPDEGFGIIVMLGDVSMMASINCWTLLKTPRRIRLS